MTAPETATTDVTSQETMRWTWSTSMVDVGAQLGRRTVTGTTRGGIEAVPGAIGPPPTQHLLQKSIMQWHRPCIGAADAVSFSAYAREHLDDICRTVTSKPVRGHRPPQLARGTPGVPAHTRASAGHLHPDGPRKRQGSRPIE